MTDQRQNPQQDRGGPQQRRRRRAHVLSWLFTIATVGFIGLYVYLTGAFEDALQPVPTPQVDGTRKNEFVVSSSTITGFDKDKQPYKLNAVVAEQDADNHDIIHMKTVTAALNKTDGTRYRLTANRGVYNSKVKILDLSGNVVVESLGRFVAKMPKATVTLKDKRLYSDAPVEVTLSTGTIKANGVEVTQNGERVLFFNKVTAVLRGKSGKEGSQ